MKCESLKRKGWEEANFRHEDLSRGLDCHKGAPTSTLLKHSRRVSLPGNQVSSVNTIMVTLIPIFTKRDCPRRRGLCPPHNVVDAAPHQAGGSLTCQRATKAPRKPAHRDTRIVHSKTTAQGSKPCLITHSRANLALTLTKLVLRTKDLYALGWLGGILGCVCDVLRLQQSSNGRGSTYI